MLIYNETKKTFLNHLLTANIEDIIQDKYEMGYKKKLGKMSIYHGKTLFLEWEMS